MKRSDVEELKDLVIYYLAPSTYDIRTAKLLLEAIADAYQLPLGNTLIVIGCVFAICVPILLSEFAPDTFFFRALGYISLLFFGIVGSAGFQLVSSSRYTREIALQILESHRAQDEQP